MHSEDEAFRQHAKRFIPHCSGRAHDVLKKLMQHRKAHCVDIYPSCVEVFFLTKNGTQT
jgi:hypothetical protein